MRALPATLTALVATGAAAAAALLATVPGAAAPGHSARTASYPATVTTVVRPVDAAGRARPGYTVRRDSGFALDCSFKDPSLGAVSSGIQTCSPSAAYAIACWKSATPHRALCLRDPSSHFLYSDRYTGRFAGARQAPRRLRAPLLVVLTDGTRCEIRDGGAWGQLKSHPRWYGTYSCSRHGVVWSAPNAAHMGIDETRASWTLTTGRADGRGRLWTQHVRRAYFAGTAH